MDPALLYRRSRSHAVIIARQPDPHSSGWPFPVRVGRGRGHRPAWSGIACGYGRAVYRVRPSAVHRCVAGVAGPAGPVPRAGPAAVRRAVPVRRVPAAAARRPLAGRPSPAVPGTPARRRELVHLHFMVVGCIFFWPLLGLDPLPGRWPYPARALLMLLSTPFHAVLGLTIMQSTDLIAGDWYPNLHLSWADPHADQVLAGGILWAGGEVVSVTMLAVLVVQWMRDSDREARRVDRRLELDRARVRAAAAAPGAATPAAASPEAAATTGAPAPAADDDVWEVPWWQTQGPVRSAGSDEREPSP